MKKTLIVSPCYLPVPAVKGGAVSTLIESIIIQNEIYQETELTVVGAYDYVAMEKSKKYKNTNFIFLNYPWWYDKIDNGIDLIRNKLSKQQINSRRYIRKLNTIRQIKHHLLNNEYDSIIFQNAGYLLQVLRSRRVREKYEGKLFYHVHNDIPSNIYVKGIYCCKLLLVSDYLKENIMKICGEDIEKQISVVKNGFNGEYFACKMEESGKEELLNQLKIPLNKKVILFAGRIDPSKGIRELTDAFSLLERKDVVLLIVGSQSFGGKQNSFSLFEEDMKRKFLELYDRVFFTGYVPYLEMWKYYSISDIAVLPSMWNEPAGLTMIEASAAGVPLITTNSGGIPEYISSDWAVLLERNKNIVYSLRGAIEEVLNNEVLWKKNGESASNFIRKHYTEKNFYYDFMKSIYK